MRPMHVLFFLVLVPTHTFAHMAMADPPALRYKTNPYKVHQDYDYLSPLSSTGANYPCKGYHVDLGSPGGRSVVSYSPGGAYNLRLDGSATHLGGSCQISLSFDGGKSFQVIKSIIGGCAKPDPQSDQTFSFTIPTDTPRGDALLAWSWFNNQGNREFYMNCAVVTITNGARGLQQCDADHTAATATSAAHAKRALGPPIFVANLGNGCSTVAGKDVEFPDPGSDVSRSGKPGQTAPPVGSCGPVSASSGRPAAAAKTCAYWRSQGYHCSGAMSTSSWASSLSLVWLSAIAAGILGRAVYTVGLYSRILPAG